MYRKKTIICNKTGLHARPVSDFVNCSNQFTSDITITRVSDGASANAKSIVKIMLLALHKGTEVELSAQGPDEKEAVDALVELIDSGFGE